MILAFKGTPAATGDYLAAAQTGVLARVVRNIAG
jgi:hypothetical protein